MTDLAAMGSNSREKRQTVLACREDIEKGRNAGYSLRKIWMVLTAQKKINYSYVGFARAVRTYIDGKVTPGDTPQITPKEKPQPVVEVVKPPPTPAPAAAKPDPGYEVATRPVMPIEPERPKPVQNHEEEESEEVAEARRQRSIAEYRAQKGKPLRFKSDYTLRMEAEKKAEQERNTQNGKDSSDSRE